MKTFSQLILTLTKTIPRFEMFSDGMKYLKIRSAVTNV